MQGETLGEFSQSMYAQTIIYSDNNHQLFLFTSHSTMNLIFPEGRQVCSSVCNTSLAHGRYLVSFC